jgi:uncharacterized membrane protein (UPF0127 family)
MEVILATSLWARLAGLLRKRCCANGEVLLLTPCRSIHTFGMCCGVDVAFIDADAKVVFARRNILPAHLCSHPKAVAVLERRSDPDTTWPSAGERMYLTIGKTVPLTSRKEGKT